MSKSRVRMAGFVAEAYDEPPAQAAPPLAWHVNRLQVDEDGQPLMEGLFSNYNDDIVLETDTNTILGRYDPARGPAQSSHHRRRSAHRGRRADRRGRRREGRSRSSWPARSAG